LQDLLEQSAANPKKRFNTTTELSHGQSALGSTIKKLMQQSFLKSLEVHNLLPMKIQFSLQLTCHMDGMHYIAKKLTQHCLEVH
jgi:hypothetical protein